MVEFGLRLRQLRQQRRLTQKQLASLIGVKNSVISFYELGDRVPSPEVVVKLASVLHVTTDYLLGLEKSLTVDTSDLDDEDIRIIREMADRLRSKNKKISEQ